MRSLLLTLVLVTGCGKNEQPPPPSKGIASGQESGPRTGRPATAEPSQAQQLFATVCTTCHGADGSGNGPAAASLNPKPRNYTDPAWQASVTDDDIKKIIVGGGPAVGKSPMMPPNPQLQDQPEILDGLVAIIRGFAKPGAPAAAPGAPAAAPGSATTGGASGESK